MEYRTEHDTLGEVKVPENAYYGAQTQRAVLNFPISNLKLQPSFIKAQASVKLSAAQANMASGRLKKKIGNAIVKASKEVFNGKLRDQFVIDVFQAGAGTSQNMNMNEVLANRAIEILGGVFGDYTMVHPNDHVNMSQSTNDTIHVIIHVSAYGEIQKTLLPKVKKLETALKKKSKEFDHIVKSGRTHLQDAVPIRLGQEFGAYASMIENGYSRINKASHSLLEICIGGTAVGTGLNTDPDYKKNVIESLNKITGYEFRPAGNLVESMQSFDAVLEVTGALRTLITSLKKIADDLRLLSSGPRTGLAEIQLPPVQPGSSIMPGKVNPVMAEMLNMICSHALGCDGTVLHAAQAGQMELNVMMPVIAYNLLEEISILANGIEAFTDKCVKGIKVNVKVCSENAERSSAVATALNPYIGYEKAAELAKEALVKNTTIRELVLSKKLMDRKKLDKILDLYGMTEDPAD